MKTYIVTKMFALFIEPNVDLQYTGNNHKND